MKFAFVFGLVSRSLIAPTFSVEIWTPGALTTLSYGQRQIFTDSNTGPMTADKQTVSEIRGRGAPAKVGVRIRLLLKDRSESL